MSSIVSPPIRPPRYPFTKSHALAVHVQSGETADGVTVPGELIDLSPGGAKVLLDSPFRFQQAVTLRLESEELGLHLSLAARVCWIRSSGAQWRLGCAFDPLLPREDVDRLLSNGVLDRRSAEREPIDRPASATWELNSQPTPVTVVDLSRGGFCLRAPLSAEPSSRLRLQVAAAPGTFVEATATVQWRLEVPEGFLLGCSLANLETYMALRSALLSEPPPRVRPKRRRWAWYALMVAACAGLAACGLAVGR